MLPERESRLGGQTQAAQGLSTGTETTTTVTPGACGRSDHALSPCPIHGCPACAAVDVLPYDDPDAFEPPVPRDHPLWDVLAELQERFVDAGHCEICAEIITRDVWARYPGWQCEMTCMSSHCEVCDTCGQGGLVCRVCELCVAHQERSSACEVWVWSTVAQEGRLIGYRHELFNTATGRWAP